MAAPAVVPLPTPELPGRRPVNALIAATDLLVALVVWREPSLIRFWPFTPAEFFQAMTPLLLVALFVERAMEILVKGLYGEGEEVLRHAAKNDPAREPERLLYKSRTRRFAFTGSVFVCIVISAIGLRALEMLIDPAVFKTLTDTQRNVFQTIDVLLTGTLLAGGADGLHKIVTLFTNSLDSQNKKLKDA
jgi:hypothetical protein